ncbi:MAG: protein-disulfide reductase DsbD domain-containing protein [Deltaproteobacteria bacterium]
MKALFALALMASPLFAQSAPLDVASVRILPGWRVGSLHYAALEVDLAPGWHTYWRVPGEAGIPPHLTWDSSSNLKSIGISWPVPELFDQNGMTSIGYTGTLILPIVLRAKDANAAIHLEGQIEIGVCNEVCTPFVTDVWADLPASGAVDPRINAADKDKPVSAAAAGVKGVTCSAEPIADGLRVSTTITIAPQGAREHVVMELADKTVWISDAKVSRQGNTLVASADMVPPNAQPFALDRSTVRLTVLAAGRAVDIQGCTGG